MLTFDLQRDYIDQGKVYCPDCFDYSLGLHSNAIGG